MILNEQHYLWLCELTGTGLLTSQHSGSVMEIVRGLQPSLAGRGQGDLAEAMLKSAHLADWELLGRGGERGSEWFLFADQTHRQGAIAVSEPRASEDYDTYSFPLDEAILKLREMLVPGGKHVFTGLGPGAGMPHCSRKRWVRKPSFLARRPWKSFRGRPSTLWARMIR